MKIEEGEIIVLDDGYEYLILKKCSFDKNDYVSLITTNKPIKLLIKKQIIKENKIILEDISEEEIEQVMQLLKK